MEAQVESLRRETDTQSAFVSVTIIETGETYRCRRDESLLEGMRRMGKRGIPVGCRGGGCSVCKVQIIAGAYDQFRPMSREYVSDQDLAADRLLACCVRPRSAIELNVVGKLKKNIQRCSVKEANRGEAPFHVEET